MSNTKLKIKAGAFELDYEGSEAFVEKSLSKFLASLPEVFEKFPSSLTITNHPITIPTQAAPQETQVVLPTSPHQLSVSSTNSIASKIKCKSGTSLLIAACAKLQLVDGQANCDRKAILNEMKSATAFYKGNMGKNLTGYFTSLVKAGTLHESSKDVYSLSHEKANELREKLAK